MPVRSRKQSSVQAKQCTPVRGIDLSRPDSVIHENALTQAFNFWYEPSYTGIVTRMGTEKVDAPQLPGAVTEMIYYITTTGEAYLVVAIRTQIGEHRLYALVDAGSGNQWQLVTELQRVPSLLNFDGYLIIADGRNGGIVSWDGATLKEIQGSPPKPTVLNTISDRVVANSLDSPDYVFFSEPENFEEWGVSEGKAGFIAPAGFGEGMEINGMTALYGMLVVSKVHRDKAGNITAKRLHMINTNGTPESWSTARLSATNATNVQNGITSVADKIFYLDSDGIQSASPAPGGAFGDIALDPEAGTRILALIGRNASQATTAVVKFVKILGQLWFIIRAGQAVEIVVYHPLQGGAWTELRYPFITGALCETGTNVLLGADDGYIYKFSGEGTDSGKPVQTVLRTKKYDQVGGDMILRAAKLTLGRISPSLIRVEAVGEDGSIRHLVAEMQTEETGAADDKIFDANYKIFDANFPIFGGQRIIPQPFDWRVAGPRSTGIYMQVRTLGGRITIDGIAALMAHVG